MMEEPFFMIEQFQPKFSESAVEDDPLEINGIRRSKVALAQEITAKLTSATKYHAELTSVVNRVAQVIG
jgi:hypothetical protein